MATPAVGQPQDFNKLLKAERDHLEFAEGLHKWRGDDVEMRILRRYGKL
jgi:ER membrane protein complex subunit 3